MTNQTTILAPISSGELIDKITILEIKTSELKNPAKLANVHRELKELNELARTIATPGLSTLQQELKEVNRELWYIENFKRECEARQQFGSDFVQAARQVYLKNDLRARIKRSINELTNSSIVEEKSHTTV